MSDLDEARARRALTQLSRDLGSTYAHIASKIADGMEGHALDAIFAEEMEVSVNGALDSAGIPGPSIPEALQ